MKLRVSSALQVRPYPGFESCGDAAFRLDSTTASLFVVVDGLGHGPDAAKSAQAVTERLRDLGPVSLKESFLQADKALAGLREVVMGAVRVEGDQVFFAGIGNIEIFGPDDVPRPGAAVGRVGRGLRSFREAPLAVAPGQRWALASDGLRHRELRRALGETRALAPVAAAARLMELVGRPDDDASVVLMDFEECP
jgi:hypothetical protein